MLNSMIILPDRQRHRRAAGLALGLPTLSHFHQPPFRAQATDGGPWPPRQGGRVETPRPLSKLRGFTRSQPTGGTIAGSAAVQCERARKKS